MWASLLAGVAVSQASPELPSGCLTMALLPAASRTMRVHPDMGVPPPDGKATRDAYDVPNARESENYVVRWGSGVDSDDVDATLEALERSWDVEIAEMGHPAPGGSDTHKFNVYIGSTGGNTPDHYGAAGYFNTDTEGWPMVVLNPSTLSDLERLKTTVAHEVYHAVQFATDAYAYEGEGAWYWEATASWIEAEVYPDNPTYVVFLFGYALLPHLEINFFDYPDTGELQEYHQYGAFIFPMYLSEWVGDWRLIRDSWVAPQATGRDPLRALEAGVEELGVDWNDAFMDFAARNVTWDYADGDLYEDNVTYAAEYFPGQDARVVGLIDLAGTSEATFEPPPAYAPRRYGSNVVELTGVAGSSVRVSLEGAEEGSSGSDAEYGMVLVAVRQGDSVERLPILVDGSSGEAVVEIQPDVRELYAVVGAWSDTLSWDEAFDYTLSVQKQEGGSDTGVDDDTASDTAPVLTLGRASATAERGCSTVVGAGGALGSVVTWLLLSGLLVNRREIRV